MNLLDNFRANKNRTYFEETDGIFKLIKQKKKYGLKLA